MRETFAQALNMHCERINQICRNESMQALWQISRESAKSYEIISIRRRERTTSEKSFFASARKEKNVIETFAC